MGRRKVSGDSTAMMSEICATSSFAATRGMTFFPKVVAGARMCVWPSAALNTSGAMTSARGWV